MKHAMLAAGLALGTLAACDPTQDTSSTPGYGPPEASGLVTAGGYPAEGDVCQVIGENELTVEYLGDASTLVGCPALETGLIEARISEGGTQVDEIGEWVLLIVPTG